MKTEGQQHADSFPTITWEIKQPDWMPPPIVLHRFISKRRQFCDDLYANTGRWFEFFTETEKELKAEASALRGMGAGVITRKVDGELKAFALWVIKHTPSEYQNFNDHHKAECRQYVREYINDLLLDEETGKIKATIVEVKR